MKKNIKEQTGAGAAGATTSGTFVPASGLDGAPSKSGAFPGSDTKRKRSIRRDSPAVKEAIKFANRMKNSSLKSN